MFIAITRQNLAFTDSSRSSAHVQLILRPEYMQSSAYKFCRSPHIIGIVYVFQLLFCYLEKNVSPVIYLGISNALQKFHPYVKSACELPSCAPLPSRLDPDSVTLSSLMQVISGSSAKLSFRMVSEMVATDCLLENSTQKKSQTLLHAQ